MALPCAKTPKLPGFETEQNAMWSGRIPALSGFTNAELLDERERSAGSSYSCRSNLLAHPSSGVCGLYRLVTVMSPLNDWRLTIALASPKEP